MRIGTMQLLTSLTAGGLVLLTVAVLQQMGDLIDSPLEFSRIGRATLKRKMVRTDRLVRECLAALKEEYAGCPVVMLTSSKEERDVNDSYALGANSYIVKPIAYEPFAEALRQVVRYWLAFNQPPEVAP